jgi:two-component system sensor histidine kinase KdpD
MVLINHSLASARAIRWAKNLAYTMGAKLIALYVETPKKTGEQESEQLSKNMNLARQFGAEVMITSGSDLVKAVLSVAHKENITHIIVGKPRQRNLFRLLIFGNFVQNLIKASGNIDVYVLGSDSPDRKRSLVNLKLPTISSPVYQYFLAVILIGITTMICYPLASETGYQVVSLILLFVVSLLSTFMGIGPILLASTLSAVVWNYFFIPPMFTFHIGKTQDILMFFMFFIVAFVNGTLTSQVRRQEKLTRDREERTNALFQLTRLLSEAHGLNEIIHIAVREIKKQFSLESSFMIQDVNNRLSDHNYLDKEQKLSNTEYSIADWVYKHSKKAGRFTDTLPSGDLTYYPIQGTRIKPGVVAVKHDKLFHGEKDLYWDTYLTQISNAIERELLDEQARKAQFLEESDKLYKTLFNSISHELRIPVATILGASDSLLSTHYNEKECKDLYLEILTASRRLNRLIDNLLNMSRLESGLISAKLDWCDINDLINKVSDNLKDELKSFTLHVVIPKDMPLVKIDFGLMEQVLHNLVYNSCQYAPGTSTIRVKAFYDAGNLVMQVMDRGPGFPREALPYVFDKFFRVKGSLPGGTGLGLSIVKGFVEAHKGIVKVENRQNGGARFTIIIPTEIHELDNLPTDNV